MIFEGKIFNKNKDKEPLLIIKAKAKIYYNIGNTVKKENKLFNNVRFNKIKEYLIYKHIDNNNFIHLSNNYNNEKDLINKGNNIMPIVLENAEINIIEEKTEINDLILSYRGLYQPSEIFGVNKNIRNVELYTIHIKNNDFIKIEGNEADGKIIANKISLI